MQFIGVDGEGRLGNDGGAIAVPMLATSILMTRATVVPVRSGRIFLVTYAVPHAGPATGNFDSELFDPTYSGNAPGRSRSIDKVFSHSILRKPPRLGTKCGLEGAVRLPVTRGAGVRESRNLSRHGQVDCTLVRCPQSILQSFRKCGVCFWSRLVGPTRTTNNGRQRWRATNKRDLAF